MPSQFDADFLAYGWPLLQGQLGEDVVYRPFGATSSDVTAIVQPEGGEPTSEADGRIQFLRATVEVSIEDAPKPDTRDAFTIGGTTYAVKSFDQARAIVLFRVEAMRQERLGGKDSHIQR